MTTTKDIFARVVGNVPTIFLIMCFEAVLCSALKQNLLNYIFFKIVYISGWIWYGYAKATGWRNWQYIKQTLCKVCVCSPFNPSQEHRPSPVSLHSLLSCASLSSWYQLLPVDFISASSERTVQKIALIVLHCFTVYSTVEQAKGWQNMFTITKFFCIEALSWYILHTPLYRG